jgi:hypothetical protein
MLGRPTLDAHAATTAAISKKAFDPNRSRRRF